MRSTELTTTGMRTIVDCSLQQESPFGPRVSLGERKQDITVTFPGYESAGVGVARVLGSVFTRSQGLDSVDDPDVVVGICRSLNMKCKSFEKREISFESTAATLVVSAVVAAAASRR